jgi:hypothetical protein
MSNTLNVTTLATLNGKSIFQCWALASGFATSSQQGTAGAQILQLGNLSNASYSILPARFNAGIHTAPTVQCVPHFLLRCCHLLNWRAARRRWVVFLSGVAHITLPDETLPIDGNSTQYATEAWVSGGPYGTILATDTIEESALGHITTYPSGEETRVLQIPIADGAIPAHTVLDATGPCAETELLGRKRALEIELD